MTQADLKLEAFALPVADVDRAKKFYGDLGWRLDADFAFDNGFRVVQFTPPGSACSIQFGARLTKAALGSAQGLYLVVSEIEQARDALAASGATISEVFHITAPRRPVPARGRQRPRERPPRRVAPATVRTRLSAIRTATAGCSRRSRNACPDVLTPT
jgi:predicted enzyme related to lactoylglutathione lyase